MCKTICKSQDFSGPNDDLLIYEQYALGGVKSGPSAFWGVISSLSFFLEFFPPSPSSPFSSSLRSSPRDVTWECDRVAGREAGCYAAGWLVLKLLGTRRLVPLQEWYISPAVIAASTAAPPSQVTQHRPMFTPISSACSGNPRCTAAAARLALRAELRNAAAPRMATVRAKGYGMSQRLRNEPKATE